MVYLFCISSTMTTPLKTTAPVAQYVRMSAELQQYSIKNQKVAIQNMQNSMVWS